MFHVAVSIQDTKRTQADPVRNRESKAPIFIREGGPFRLASEHPDAVFTAREVRSTISGSQSF